MTTLALSSPNLDYLEEVHQDKKRVNKIIGSIFEDNNDTLNELPNLFRLNSIKRSISINSKVINSSFKGYDHATWYVSNAKQTANYFVSCFGFKWFACKGLETGSKIIASHVVKNGDVIFEFISPIVTKSADLKEQVYLNKIFEFIKKHGDGVKDISFKVKNVELIYENAIKHGAKSINKPYVLTDEYGLVKVATIEVFDDVYHTLIERDLYNGHYLPGYVDYNNNDIAILNEMLPIELIKIDHCVQNEDWNELESACNVYSKIFGFHKFWSVDEKDVSTEFSALRSIVMASENEEIKMPINEPAKGLCKSQIEEFLTFYNGPGVQHIAILTSDIIKTVENMTKRGAEFIKVPNLYYEKLLPKLLKYGSIKEDLAKLEKLGILIDFDESGYLLQIFTKPLTDRPTFFLEIIQRNNHSGFGKGNFKALFETIEAEQKLRGTL